MGPFCIVIDVKRCIFCQACVAHCKTKNAVPEGVLLSTLKVRGPYLEAGKCIMRSEFQTCYHCEKAWCLEICPSKAIHRNEDGTVWIDEGACIGCGFCSKACPWHMPHMVKIVESAAKPKRVAIKCDHCRDLRSQGLQPACVTACTARALQYMPLSQAPQEFQERYAQRMEAEYAQADAFVGKILAKRSAKTMEYDIVLD